MMDLEQPALPRSAARAAFSAVLRRHKTLLGLWRALYRPILLLHAASAARRSALAERRLWAEQYAPGLRELIVREAARRARRVPSRLASPTRRVAFVNDLGFLYGAGIAQRRQAASFLLHGWSVSIFASQSVPIPRYACFTGSPKLDRRLIVRRPLRPHAFSSEIMNARPEFVIVGNIHGAGWPVGVLSDLRDQGAAVVAYMHDCYWVTGRCAYPRTCTRYIAGCDASCPTPHEYPRLAPEKIYDAWRERERCFTGPNAIPLVANSTWTAQLARKRFPAARVDVIHLGLDHNLFAPMRKEVARQMMRLPADKPVVLLGSLNVNDEIKGGRLFRELCAMLSARSDIRLAAVGKDSNTIPGARSFGLIDDELLMPLILNCADVYVSTAVEEAFGQMLLEAAACGIPTVAIAAGGVCDIVTEETGILVRERSAGALMAAIDALLSNAALRERMSRAARARVLQNFTLSRQADAWRRYLAARTISPVSNPIKAQS